MSTILLLVLITGFLTVVLLTWGIYLTVYRERLEIEKRLEGLSAYGSRAQRPGDEELAKSFSERILRPALNQLGSFTSRFFSSRNQGYLEKQLLLAGNPFGLNAKEFSSLYVAVSIGLGALLLLFMTVLEQGVFMQIMGALWGIFFGRVLLGVYLKLRISGRQMEISRALPDVLDLLTVSVEAGLGFDMAIQKVVSKTKGPLSMEFEKTLQEIKMGKQRRDALKDLGQRTGVENLNTLISAIIQVDQLGVSIGNVLRTQSKQIRLLQKQKVEEKAMKAPIKMLIPMILFIFPTIFLVLLGPAVLQMIDVMK